MKEKLRQVMDPDILCAATDVYIVVMLLLFPLFFGFSGYENITVFKFSFFTIITSIWLLSLIFLKIKKLGSAPANRPAVFLGLCFMAVCTVSFLLSPFKEDGFIGSARYDGLFTLLLYACIFMGTACYARIKPLHMAALGISVSICCIIAVFQLFDINILGLFPDGISYYDAGTLYSGEFLGTIGNSNLLSAYLSLAIPCFFSLSVLCRKKWAKTALIPLFLGVLILTASKVSGGMFAFLAFLLLCSPFLLKNHEALQRYFVALGVCFLAGALAMGFAPGYEERVFTSAFVFTDLCLILAALCAVCFALSALLLFTLRISDKAIRRGYIIIAAVILLSALVFIYNYGGTSGTVYEFSQLLHGRIEDSFGSSRIGIWKEVINLVPEKPIFGAGPDSLAHRLDIVFSRYVPETGETLSTVVDNAHNEFLGYAANLGIFGLVAYSAIVIFSLKSINRSKNKTLFASLFCGAVGYLIQSFFGLGLCIVVPIFWIFLGCLAAAQNSP